MAHGARNWPGTCWDIHLAEVHWCAVAGIGRMNFGHLTLHSLHDGIDHRSPPQTKIALFRNLFRGRKDVGHQLPPGRLKLA
jgi:hypothetical protein